jgi:hypothetical protein
MRCWQFLVVVAVAVVVVVVVVFTLVERLVLITYLLHASE